MVVSLLDHVVLAGPDLPGLVSCFWGLTGVDPVLGARCEQEGTASYLVGLGGMRYLQLVGPDPAGSRPGPPTVFGIHRLTGPRVAGWVIRPRHLGDTLARARAAGYDLESAVRVTGPAPAGGSLPWRVAHARDDLGGLVPGLIDWQASPHPDAAARAIAAVGAHLVVDAADIPGLTLRLDTPNGPITWD